MALWKQLLQPPAGALPGHLITTVGVGVIAVLIVGLVLSQSGGDPEPNVVTIDDTGVVEDGLVGRLRSRLTQLEAAQQLAELRRAQQAAATQAAAQAQAARPPDVAPDGAPPSGTVGSADRSGLPTDGEIELRERLRLEALERRTRSLRAPSVVQMGQRDSATRTSNDEQADAETLAACDGASATGGGETAADGPAASPGPSLDTATLAAQLQDANAALVAGLTGNATPSPPPVRTVPGVTGSPVAPATDPAVLTSPENPAGWERIYEGSILSAVLVTQLDGEFTGPVLAQVAIPFYTADRQRVLVPRGARLLGTAQAVQHEDQSRLAVGFHRLVWPDGRWVDLAFHGLNALGESALRDQVDRHYASTFAAAGAVGLLAGLTLQGADPYAGGAAGFRAAAGQGLGQSATEILGRFLNRLPTVTIRAGHRLRVWVTRDVLAPRPAPFPGRSTP